MKNDIKQVISNKREFYKNLERVVCPYVNCEVYFTSAGFNHLLWKNTAKMRSIQEIKNRLDALGVVLEILSKSGTLQEYECNNQKEFLCFIAIIDSRKYKVVITRVDINKYKFVSVIPKWKTGIRDQ